MRAFQGGMTPFSLVELDLQAGWAGCCCEGFDLRCELTDSLLPASPFQRFVSAEDQSVAASSTALRCSAKRPVHPNARSSAKRRTALSRYLDATMSLRVRRCTLESPGGDARQAGGFLLLGLADRCLASMRSL
ncbi:hypothetical protein PF008_g14215 [Phytophthora fragariae]|uniref:Uncharacterized protein n=1 Tax=Phytophthora fragariae TaxID=53985 RepID=A0A6G0RI49_9STRA|nr:hypothetical protein PF008_g14215 [Phytophthora fragariae]